MNSNRERFEKEFAHIDPSERYLNAPYDILLLHELNLNDQQLQNYLLRKMIEYREKDGWWTSPEKTPFCAHCKNSISGPEDLVRQYGVSVHTSCFTSYLDLYSEIDNSFIEDGEDMVEIIKINYWKRVARLLTQK